ncbi:MAG: ATP synthase F0 subunit B [Candidatus Obscuribacterales bacterium]|nr:ATP synthase F0 subunit B [Candidatus Obscuribacterales bacterium]
MSTLTAPNATVTNNYKQTTIYKHMDLLEHLIEDAPGVYKFKFINADDFLDVLDKARARLPEELREAAEVLLQRDQITTEAHRRSEHIVQQARRQAEMMLQESELLKAVQAEVERIRKQVVTEIEQMRREALAEAERIRIEAEEDATRIRDGADHYAESVLTRVDTDLAQIAIHVQDSQSIVRNGQRLLGQVKRVQGSAPAAIPSIPSMPAVPPPNLNNIQLSSPLLRGGNE